MAKFICGKNSVLEAIENNVPIDTLYVLKLLKLKNKSIKIKVITKDEMNEITNLNHQGYVAMLKTNFQYSSIDDILNSRPPIVLVVDHIEDPHNFGAIIRSANAAGIRHIIIPKERSVNVNETVIRISSGGIVDMKIIRVNSLQSTIDKLKQNNYWIYASAIEKGMKYDEVNYNFPLAIIVGNESKGVSKTLLKQSDQNIFIPMNGTVQSLNVSVATGIILFEIIKKIIF